MARRSRLCNPEQRLLPPEPGRKLYPFATALQLDPCSVTLALDNDIVDVGERIDVTRRKRQCRRRHVELFAAQRCASR
jgi:hypothetical protein